MLSRVEESDTRLAGLLGLAGTPFGGAPSNINNRIISRFYIDENNPASFKIGDWRKELE